jgi:hypothetical protein
MSAGDEGSLLGWDVAEGLPVDVGSGSYGIAAIKRANKCTSTEWTLKL